jgi:hypothetical protein
LEKQVEEKFVNRGDLTEVQFFLWAKKIGILTSTVILDQNLWLCKTITYVRVVHLEHLEAAVAFILGAFFI